VKDRKDIQHKLMTVQEVARVLRVTPDAVRKNCRKGVFDCVRVGGCWRVKRAFVEWLIEENIQLKGMEYE